MLAGEASFESCRDADKRGEPGIVFLARLGKGLETGFLIGGADGVAFSAAGASGGAGFSEAFASAGVCDGTDGADSTDGVGVSV